MSLPGGKQCKETLLRKACESAAHVAGFGLHLEGFGPPNHPKRFFDSLKHRFDPVLQTIDKLSREAGVCFLVAKPKGKWSKGVEYISKEQRS